MCIRDSGWAFMAIIIGVMLDSITNNKQASTKIFAALKSGQSDQGLVWSRKDSVAGVCNVWFYWPHEKQVRYLRASACSIGIKCKNWNDKSNLCDKQIFSGNMFSKWKCFFNMQFLI